MIEQPFPVFGLRRNLCKPNNGFQRLHLAKERADAAEFVMPPVLKKTGSFRSDLPLIRIGQGTPCIHKAAHFINDGSRVILLRLCGKPLPLIEYECVLCSRRFPFLWLGNGCYEINLAASSRIFCVGCPDGSNSQCLIGRS